MNSNSLPTGTIHNKIPIDLQKAFDKDDQSPDIWCSLTPLARNEWICWIENAKLNETRKRRIERTVNELKEGKRRPCCWIGCIHRTDKEVSKSVKWVLSRNKK